MCEPKYVCFDSTPTSSHVIAAIELADFVFWRTRFPNVKINLHNSSHHISCINNSSFKQIVMSLVSDNYLYLLNQLKRDGAFKVSSSTESSDRQTDRQIGRHFSWWWRRGEIALYLPSSLSAWLKSTLHNVDFKFIFLQDGQPCSNNCCRENPCSNGGTCTELCAHANRKFDYTCAIGCFGKFYEKKSPTSSKQLQIEAKKLSQSAVYTMYDPTSKSFYQTF